jgi:predicted dehydrogenase
MLRVAVVGLGYWGPNIVRNIAASPRWELTAIVDRDANRLSRLARHYPATTAVADVGDVLDGVDAVVVATPPNSHAALAREALEAGKHVLIEKPMTTDPDDAAALADLADRRRLVLAVDHTFLYTGAVEYLQRAIARGDLGQIYGLDSIRVNLGLYQRFASVYDDLATHDIAIFNHLLGEVPSHVAAVSFRMIRESISDVAYVTLRYPSGVHGHIHVSWLSPVKVRQMTIAGSQRMAIWNDVEPSEKVRVYDKGVEFSDDPEARAASFVSYRAGDMHAPALDTTEALAKVLDSFADAILGGVPMRSGAQDGIAVVNVLTAIERSIAADGAFVPVQRFLEIAR